MDKVKTVASKTPRTDAFERRTKDDQGRTFEDEWRVHAHALEVELATLNERREQELKLGEHLLKSARDDRNFWYAACMERGNLLGKERTARDCERAWKETAEDAVKMLKEELEEVKARQKFGGFEKLDSLSDPCRSPEHRPPSHVVLEPGTYRYTCPVCGDITPVYVPRKG